MAKAKAPRPLKGGYMVLRTEDGKDWCVIGYKCAAPVPGTIERSRVVAYAIARQDLWLFD